MATTVVPHSVDSPAIQKAQTKPEQDASPKRPVDKFVEAARARKKAKRVKHRAKLRRSHTNG
jgi:hypothetical protein